MSKTEDTYIDSKQPVSDANKNCIRYLSRMSDVPVLASASSFGFQRAIDGLLGLQKIPMTRLSRQRRPSNKEGCNNRYVHLLLGISQGNLE